MSESSGGATDIQVPTQLTNLVPQFDPSQHDLEQYSQKAEMLAEIWPAGKTNELITRLILNTSGVAFQKLQLQRSELLTGDKKGVAKLITILGGQWGKVSLERKYETFERAVYRCQQKTDESHDSFLARADVLWSELLASKVTLQELQAYTVLRGSMLSAEDKKRVVLESEASESGKLEMSKVTAAVRMLGSGFFQDVTGIKKVKGKVYDAHAMIAEEADDAETALVAEEWNEDEMLEHLAADGDEDAALICEFEAAIQETIQDDEELMPEKGHWRAECPDRLKGTSNASSASQAPTMSVTTDQALGDSEAMLPMEPPIRNPHIDRVQITMSLADRLSKVCQSQDVEESLDAFKAKSLEAMGAYPVTFGKTHLGKSYIEIWSSQSKWLQWFIKTYEQSTKIEHQKLLHFTTLMIERAELEQTQEIHQMPVAKAKAVPKAKIMPMPAGMSEIDLEEGDDDVWLTAEMANQPNYAATPVMEENMNALQGRMDHMESALGEILNHLRTNNS
eukprot:s1712_g1.t1